MQISQSLYEKSTPLIIHMANGPEIMPFRNEYGVPNFSNIQLAQVYRRLAMEETISKVFYDGSINNTADFIEFCHNPDNEIFLLKTRGREAGFFWLNSFKQKSSFITYCFYRDFWGQQAQEISEMALEYLFSRTDINGEHLTDFLLGVTPANNKLAIKFMLKNNMTIMGRVQNFLYDYQKNKSIDGILSYRQRLNNVMTSLSGQFFIK